MRDHLVSSQESPDVTIVGAGVIGVALGLALQRAGISATLVERAAAPRAWDAASGYDLRVFALSPASVRLLEALGAWAYIAKRRASPYRAMRVWEREPAQALEFDASAARAPQLGFIVEQDLLLEALLQAPGAAALRRGRDVAGLAVGADCAQLALDDGSEIASRLVVAADGADSRLRELAGIETVTWDYPERAIVCHVATGEPHRATAWQRFLPTGPLAFLPLADGRSSIVWSTTEADDLLALGDDEFRARLGEASQQALGTILDCTPRKAFGLRMLHATAYVRERVALAGDSAHVIHPLAGQGVNIGLADVQSLAAVLEAAHAQGRDFGTLRVLKRYARARKADNLDMIALTDALQRLFGLRAPGLERLLDAGMSLVNRLPLAKQALMRRALGAD